MTMHATMGKDDLLDQAHHLEACVLALEALRCGDWGLGATLSDQDEDARLDDLARILGMEAGRRATELRRKIEAAISTAAREVA